jgi:hypothetical protein
MVERPTDRASEDVGSMSMDELLSAIEELR